ncbi:MAG: hypothetical protein ACREO5_00150 [Candidatus Binatia bacterium]
MIQDTSLEALRRVHPKITKSQDAVLRIIREHPEGLTDAEINHYLGWTINRVTPRRNELQKLGLIYDTGRRECRKTHSYAHAYKAKIPVLPPAFEEKPVDKQNLFAT